MNELQTTLGIIATRTVDNSRRLQESKRQTRNLVTDDFDKEYSAIGENGSATIWLAISGDMIYMARWEFKLIVEEFTVPISSDGLGATGLDIDIGSSTISPTSLSATGSGGTTTLQPNPHTHNMNLSGVSITPNPHTHEIKGGVTHVPVTFTNLKILLDDIDLTEKFKEQHSTWIDGEGMYPDTSLHNRYDILKAIVDLSPDIRTGLIKQGYHKLTLQADGLFSFKIREFKKYSFLNRE